MITNWPILKIIRRYFFDFLVILTAVSFSSWLMFHTFSYSSGNLEIASKVWSDFASSIPLIRSFSLGQNWPLEYPIFPDAPIKYHFLFYLLVGNLEKIGLPLDYALNLPSIIGFSLLLIVIYYFSWLVFKRKIVGLLAVIFFLFNGSLSFIEFLQTHPLDFSTFLTAKNLTTFEAFGPYDNNIISAFWNLNIYTNQRHLALAYAISLIMIILALRPILKNTVVRLRLYILLGIILGLYPFFHLAVFFINFVVLGMLFILIPKIRQGLLITLTIGGLLALPQYLYLISSSSGFSTRVHLGYLMQDSFTLFNFLRYWLYNLGLHLLLIPLGVYLAPPLAKRILLATLPLFIIANTIQFSPEIAANHKFFNYFLIIGVMFSASTLVYLWEKLHHFRYILIIPCLLLILSGILDLFPIINDKKITVADYPNNPDVAWIIQNTPLSSVFLNTSYIYDTASLAGRKIFMGWPYFAWSAGYNTDTRGMLMEKLLGSTNKSEACALLQQNKLKYIEITRSYPPDPNVPFISSLYEEKFQLVYTNPSHNYQIFDVEKSCRSS